MNVRAISAGAKPAAHRLLAYAVGGALLVILGAGFVTNGFQQVPDWQAFHEWVATGGRP